MQKHETQITEVATVVCDGGTGAQGHPRVFLDLEKTGEVYCPYCSRHFVLKDHTH